MDFSVKQIKELLSKAGLPVEALNETAEEICSRHNTTLDAIKEERDNFKRDAETLASVKKELDDLKAQKDDGYREKYEKEHQNFEKYKSDVKAKETADKIRSEYRKLLDGQKIAKEDADLIMNGTKFDDMKLDDNGALADSDNLTNAIKEHYARYIPEEGKQGADVKKPHINNDNGGKPGANPRAVELAKQYHERRYGKAPESK